MTRYEDIRERLRDGLGREPYKAESANIFFRVAMELSDDTVIRERCEELTNEIIKDYVAWEVKS